MDVEEVQDGAISSLTLAKRRFGSAWRLQLGQRSRRGPFGRVGLALKRGPFETYASVGRRKPLQEPSLAPPPLNQNVRNERKDAQPYELSGCQKTKPIRIQHQWWATLHKKIPNDRTPPRWRT